MLHLHTDGSNSAGKLLFFEEILEELLEVFPHTACLFGYFKFRLKFILSH